MPTSNLANSSAGRLWPLGGPKIRHKEIARKQIKCIQIRVTVSRTTPQFSVLMHNNSSVRIRQSPYDNCVGGMRTILYCRRVGAVDKILVAFVPCLPVCASQWHGSLRAHAHKLLVASVVIVKDTLYLGLVYGQLILF